MDPSQQGQLSYGNLGRPTYDSDHGNWQFSRSAVSGRCLRVIASDTLWPKLLDDSEIPDEQKFSHLRPARVRSRRLDALLQRHPEFAPGASVLGGLEQVSSAVLQLEQEYEPLSSCYVAYGTIEYENPEAIPFTHRSRQILATVTGVSKHIVRLNLVHEELRYGLQDAHSFEFAANRFDRDHAMFWGGAHKTRILDVQFSVDDGNGSLLAIRRYTTVNILRPILRQTISTKSNVSKTEIGTGEINIDSQLDPNWILNISFTEVSSPSIIDFTFHPQTQEECVILDQSGDLRFINIRAPQHKWEQYSAIVSVNSIVNERGSKGRTEDRWSKVLWLDSNRLILSATRHTLSLHTFNEDDIATAVVILDETSQTGSIMDMRYDVQHGKHVFVLTSTHLLVLSRTRPGTALENKKLLITSASLPHFRDADDVSLQIAIAIDEEGANVLIFSRISPLVTGLTISFSRDTGDLQFLSDPFLFDMPAKAVEDQSPQSHGAIGRNVSSLRTQYIQSESFTDRKEFMPRLVRNVQLLEIIILDHANRVSRIIAVAQDYNLSRGDVVLLPSIANPAVDFSTTIHASGNDEFMVSNDASVSEESVRGSLFMPHQHEMPSSKRTNLVLNNFGFLGHEITNRINDSSSMVQSIGSFESALEDILESRTEMQHGIHTLMEFLSNNLPVDRIDEVADRTFGLLETIRELSKASVSGQGLPDLPHILRPVDILSQTMADELQGQNRDYRVHLIPIYENLLQLYLHSLPPDSPSDIKVWLENIVRRASMHLFLSGHGILTISPEVSTQTEVIDGRSTIADTSELTLPVRPRDLKKSTISSEPQSSSRGAASSASPGIDSGPDSQLSLQSSTENDPNHLSSGTALAQYITFRSGANIPKSIRKRIPEWQIGEYPTGLEWKSLSRTASQESLQSSQNDRRNRRVKGKEKVNDATTKSPDNPVLSSWPTIASGVPTADLDVDLDDYLLASQQLPSQFQGASQISQSDVLEPQKLATVPGGMKKEGISSQNKVQPSKKRTASKKRPSGFR